MFDRRVNGFSIFTGFGTSHVEIENAHQRLMGVGVTVLLDGGDFLL